MRRVLVNSYLIISLCALACIACVCACTYQTVMHVCMKGNKKKHHKDHEWGENACRIIITLCELSCVFILLCSHVYVSKQIGPARTF